MGYQVVLSGALRAGVDLETARRNIGALFAIDNPAALDRLLSGREVVLKRNLDRVRAGRYLAALRRAGLECDVRPPLHPAPAADAKVVRLPQRFGVPARLAMPLPAAARRPAPPAPAQPRRLWFPLGLCLLALVWLLQGAADLRSPQETRFGQKKLMAVSLPAAQLDDYNALPAFTPGSDRPLLDRTLSMKGVEWSDRRPRLFTAADSPYTLVLRLQARALADGDASARAALGYALHGKARSSLLFLRRAGVRAGERFTLVRAGTLAHFGEDQRRALHVVLGNRHNLSVEQAEMEVWSGKPGLQLHWTLYAMLGLTVLYLVARWRHGKS